MRRIDGALRPRLRAIDTAAIQSAFSVSGVLLIAALASGLTGMTLGLSAIAIVQNSMPMWILGRATGITSYLLLTGVTAMGLLLSHKTRARHRPNPDRIRLHLALVIFTLAFTVLHVVVLAVDPYAQVGWIGAVLPMGSAYRPMPVTLGLLAVWSGLISGLSTALAGRGMGRVWLYLHRFAGVGWVLAWLHGVLTGIDTKALIGMYMGTGVAIMTLGLWRYLTQETAIERAQDDRMAVRVR